MENTKIDRLFKIVYLLLLHGSMTGEQLSGMLGVSLRSIHRYIKQLNSLGFNITSRNGGYRGGYRLALSAELKKELLELIYSK